MRWNTLSIRRRVLWAVVPALLSMIPASASAHDVPSEASEPHSVRPATTTADREAIATRIAEAAAAAREQRHVNPAQRSSRRVRRSLDHPERLIFGGDLVRAFSGATHGYVRFDEIPDWAERRSLREQGVLLTDYVGDGLYVAAVTERGRTRLAAEGTALELRVIPIEDKIAVELLGGKVPDWAANDGRAQVHVRFHETVSLAEARDILVEHGVTLLDERGYRGFFTLDGSIDPAAIRDLARRDRVRSISAKPPEFVPLNAAAAELSGTAELWAPPYDLHGAGYTVGVWDAKAPYLAHSEFDGRVELMEWTDPADLAEIGYPDQHAVMVVSGHTSNMSYSLTQNLAPTIVEAAAENACYAGSGPTTGQTWMRVFDLNVEHGIGLDFCVDGLRYAVEDSAGNPDVTFRVYCTPPWTAGNDAGTVYVNQLTLRHTVTVDHPDMQLAFRDQPLQGCCNATFDSRLAADLAISVTSENCAETGNCDRFLLGSNDDGQTKPTYYSAPDCGIVPVDPAAYGTHATHVSGTIGANGTQGGVDSDRSHGMANQVNVQAYEFFGYNVDFLNAIEAGEIAVSNNGWGYDIGWYWSPSAWNFFNNTADFGAYKAESFWVDNASVFAEASGQPFVTVFAAGNERDDGFGASHDGTFRADPSEINTYYDTINPLAGAKNAITVGAIDSQMAMTPYSSWGPCNDGRIKPDLVAQGHALTSTSGPWEYAYEVLSGTSMAAAVVSGSAVLAIEQYEATFGTVPTNGEMKALLINSTIDLGRPGPDYVYGYGLFDGQEAVDTILAAGVGSSIRSGQIGQGQTHTYNVSVPPGTPTLKATLAWMDWPGNTVGLPAIVNNLDLRLIGPSGQIRYPFKLNVLAPVAVATATGVNTRDTVEQVVVEAPESGSWTVEVKGTLVPQGPQVYGLVSRNGLIAPVVYDVLPPQRVPNFPYPYAEGTFSAKYTDPSGGGIDTGTVTMRANWSTVTNDAVISSQGVYYVPGYPLSNIGSHWFEIYVSNTAGLQTSVLSTFDYVQAGEVEGLLVAKGAGANVNLTWGDPPYDSSKLEFLEFRVYRSTNLATELTWIATTNDHAFTDTAAPANGLVAYEVHALFDSPSATKILSTRATPHRTRQPFLVHPRDAAVEPTPAGDTQIRLLGMAEAGSTVTVWVDGAPVGSTTALDDGSFVYVHDFGGPGSHTMFVQAGAPGKSLSVPSVEANVQLVP